ncbi:MAG: hypothetical protein M9899_08975 [Bdellovibrionaceae bacterium]|nr:hypothetical protein [Pseudobdellovibrionaceae bacterium]
MTHNDQWFKEPVSDDLKNKIFAQVQPELEDNKRRFEAEKASATPYVAGFWSWKKSFRFSAIAAAFALMFFLRTQNIIEVEYPATTFSELASLTPEVFEVIENLDFIDQLDNIDLEEIRKEMKQKNRKGRSS